MKVDKFDQSTFLVLKAAYLYYILEKQQNQIAEEMDVSITTVSRLLKRAKDERIIEFVIRDPYVECLKMGQKIKDVFGLREVVIAPAIDFSLGDDETAYDPESVKKLVALEGARYLQRIIKEKDVLGVTWGSTIYQLINYLNPAQKVDATFVTLHGSLAYCVNEWDVRTLVSRMAKAFSGCTYTLLTNTLMSSKKTVDMLKQEKNMMQVYEMFEKINIAVVGTGSLYPELSSILTRPEYLMPGEVELLQKKGAVGDIALRFFDKNGEECDTDLKERTISIDFKTFKKIKKKIMIASDVSKAHTLYYALCGGLIDVLIIDNRLGEAILKLKGQSGNRLL